MTPQQGMPAAWAAVGVNVDIEAIDALNAGAGGLFGRHSYGRYGLREGLDRLVAVFAECGAPATFYVPLSDLQRHAPVLQKILDAGHEIATRGSVAKGASQAQQADALAAEREAMARVIGQAPAGWRSLDGSMNRHTLPALAEAGYQYDSSFCDDDLPYALGDGHGRRLVELPVFDYLTDAPFFSQRHTHDRVRKAWLEEGQAQYNAGAFVHLTLHTRGDSGSTRLPRVALVAQWLRSMSAKPGLRFERAMDVAARWGSQDQASEPFPDHPSPRI